MVSLLLEQKVITIELHFNQQDLSQSADPEHFINMTKQPSLWEYHKTPTCIKSGYNITQDSTISIQNDLSLAPT